jgi:hypothetical protein
MWQVEDSWQGLAKLCESSGKQLLQRLLMVGMPARWA